MAITGPNGTRVLSQRNMGKHFETELGTDTMDLEAITDMLSDEGWKLDGSWIKPKRPWDDRGFAAEVSRIPVRDYDAGSTDLRRADIALALVAEDTREGESRTLRDRVDFAVNFEDEMRARGDMKHGR